MGGIFGGIEDMITGGGGSPGIQGMSGPQQQSLQQWQLANAADSRTLLSDWWGMAQNQYGAQQSMLPFVYNQLGVTPTYGENGEVIGYQNTGPGPEEQSAMGQEAATARLLGYNPVTDANGRVDWNATIAQGGGLGEDQPMDPSWLDAQRDSFIGRTDEQYGVGRGLQQDAYGDLMSGGVDAAMDSLQGQLRTSDYLMPAALQRLGLYADASVGGYATDPNSPEAQSRGLESQYLTRAQQGLRGELPVDPGLQRQLQEEEQQIRNQLAASLGPDYATSTPGQQALADFAKRRTEILYNAQQDAASSGVTNALGLRQGNLASWDRINQIGAPQRQTASLLGNMGLNRSQALAQTALMLQPMLQNQANATLGFQSMKNNMNLSRGDNAFKTLAAMYGTGQGYGAAGDRTRAKAGSLMGASTWGNQAGDFGDITKTAGLLGNQNTALPWAQARWQSDVTTDATNINNIWWRNFMQSAGSSTGKMAGSASGAFI